MSDDRLKNNIVNSLWRVVDRYDGILSATLTGSFVNSNSLEGLSDIDLVVVLDELNQERFESLQNAFQTSLQPVLNEAGYALRINPTLGPLKFNQPKLAVLHLMLYSQQAHVEHVINSPFTCLDWQESPVYRKQLLADVYPAFALQPRHFLSSRRSVLDYLSDFRASVVSFRELVCDESGYAEKKRVKPMDNRDRHEFAYHVMRFLMLNLLKLVRKLDGPAPQLSTLMDRYFELFPLGENDARPLLMQLAEKKRRTDFQHAIDNIGPKLERFIELFEQQFRANFIQQASRHLAFRHAPTLANRGATRFLGRSNVPIIDAQPDVDDRWENARSAVAALNPATAFVSPLDRCRQTLQNVVGEHLPYTVDQRLIEINYGHCEMLAVADCRQRYPKLFESWQQGEDPRFPDGENTADVHRRAWAFANQHWVSAAEDSVTCTHNVVLRCLIGEALRIPPSQRFRIQVPHLTAIEFVATEKFGLFVNLNENVERELFRQFAAPPVELKLAS